MKKLLLLVSLLLILGIFIAPSYFKEKVGDIRPAILPPKEVSEPQEPKESNGQKVGGTADYLQVPTGFKIGIFAKSIENARDLEFSPQGILLVSSPSNGAVVALPDKNKDGVADSAITVLSKLNRPHGLAFFNGKLFVAEESQVSRYNWDESTLTATLDKKLFDLPRGGRHFTRTITFKKDSRMFVSLGSSCDVCVEEHPFIATVIVSDQNGTSPKVFAKGLRNAVFITTNPQTDDVWVTEMGRDFLGDNLPPDEINILEEGDYGWPLCYGNRVHDTNFDKRVYIQTVPPLPCGTTIPPVYEIPAHSAPLGLTFIEGEQFPKDWQGDLLVAYHGSWNSSVPVGYKIVRLDVDGDRVLEEEDFITGFLKGSQAVARPVDVVFEPSASSGQGGSLFISDDKGGNIYKVVKE